MSLYHSFLHQKLLQYNIDVLYITEKSNIQYLTGFSGSFGVVLVTREQIILVTDMRYYEEAKKNLFQTKVLDVFDPEWEQIVSSAKIIAFEEKHMTVERFKKLQQKFFSVKWVPAFPLIEEMRRRKNVFEQTAIKTACSLACKTLEEVLPYIQEGVTEKEIEWKLIEIAHHKGGGGLSFVPIVAFEENSTVPHHIPTDKKLFRGDTVLIDFGVKYHGYRSDMARTFFYNFVSPEKQNIYEKLKKNQQYALQNIAPGKVAGEFFSEVAKKFHDQGLSKFLYSSIGHGIGIKNHEMPSLKLVSEEVLLESEILTIEPGIYFPGKYGMRLEDVVFLSSEGTQVFTDFSKDLRVI